MASSITVLFFVVLTITFVADFIRRKAWREVKEVASMTFRPALKESLIVSLPYVALFYLSNLADLHGGGGALTFALGVIVPYLLACYLPSANLRSLVLLAMAYTAEYAIPGQGSQRVEALLLGMLVSKLVANLLGRCQTQLEDLVPSFVFLSTLLWTADSSTYAGLGEKNNGLIVGVISVALLLRWLGELLIGKDKVYVKRIVLAAAGALGVLCITSKMLIAGSLDKMAILAGAGFLGAYILQSIDNNQEESFGKKKFLIQLLLLGIYTVVATRIFGNLGTLLVAATMLVTPTARSARLAAFFFCGRAILQGFVTVNNQNVTGINLCHPYTSATLYAGILIMVALALAIRDLSNKRLLALIFLSITTAAPIACAFFLHVEPISSFLVAASTAAIILAMCQGTLFGKDIAEQENLILAPVLMTAFSIYLSGVLMKGEEATTQDRLTAVGVLAVVLLCVSVTQKFLSGPPAPSRLTAVEPS